tara:strand:- start:101 stop:217 length:117 start_codon:yes stop_codon:yes gene_type:complete
MPYDYSKTFDDKTKQQLDILVGQHGHTLDVHARPEWYF